MKQILTLFVAFTFCNLIANNPNSINPSPYRLSSSGFEKNMGQVLGEDKNLVNYFYKSGQLTIFLTKQGLTYQFEKIENLKPFSKDIANLKRETYRMDMLLEGVNSNAEILNEDSTYDYTNYYQYNVLKVPSYRKIIYKNIYPNIDWVIYQSSAVSPQSSEVNTQKLAISSQSHERSENTDHASLTTDNFIKYDFVVHPGGNPAHIRFKIKWAEEMTINQDGQLLLKNSLGEISEAKPISFQGDTKIETYFSLDQDVLSFRLGDYNKKETLIIDPILQWATYYGGSNAETGGYITIDGSGNVYLCGATASTTSIASGGHQTSFSAVNDAFLVKFNSSGVRQWATYYGGADDDRGTYCHVDKNNNVYLAGRAMSTASIASTGAHQTTHGGDFDAFVVKFNSSGTRQWATYYGGGNIEEHVTCATDTGLNVYLAGTTQSNNNIFAGGFQNTFGGFSDAFLVKFNASGVRQWGTFYGGTALDEGGQCAVDKNGSVYLGGTTLSTTNISGSGFQNTKNAARDAFLVKFNPNGTRAWGTYYGGSQPDYGNSVCVDTFLNVYLSGFTYSTSDIANGGFQNTFGGSNDAYLVKFNTSGSRLWGTYYGGTNGDYGPHCITDKAGNVYLSGYTLSTNAIASAGLFNTSKGNIEGYIVKFNPSGFRFWGSYYGGTNDDYLLSSVPDGFGNTYYSGQTLSSTQISSSGHQNTYGGAGDVFLVKMSEDPIPYIEIFSNKGDTICQGDSIIFTQSNVNGGSNPRYRWLRNNVLVDTTTSFKAGGFATGDSVKCLMISNAAGLLYDSAWSLAIRFFVHPKKFTTLNIDICRPASYFFKGQQRTISGTYRDTLLSSKGCDSIITLNLTVRDTTSFTRFDTICSNQSLFFNGLPRTIAGIYRDTLTNSSGCDSFLYLNLFVKNTSNRTIDTSICPKNPYFFNGIWRTTSGTYLDTLINSRGCDSFLTLNLTVKLNSTKTIDTAICNGLAYWFKGQNRTTAGTYRDTLVNSQGCDSFVILNLTIKSLSSTNLAVSICDNQTYTFKGIPRNTSGTYRDTLVNATGCDSIITLNLTVNPRTYRTIYDTICSNKTYLFDGNNINTAGTYYDTLINSKNCDSIITLHLFVKSISNFSFNQTICSNSSYFFNGQPRNTAGIYLDTLTNSKGCDSFITLNLFVNTTSFNTLNKEICLGDSILFNGVYRKTTEFYRDTLMNSNGCDSFLDLNLLVRSPSFYSYSESRCKTNPYFFNGSFLSFTGIYRDTLVNQYGCDSFITLNYTSKDTTSFTFSTSICQGNSYIFGGVPRSTSGIYKLTLTNSQGCDSFVTLNLAVYPTYTRIIDTSVCIGGSVFFKGGFISTPGIYTDSLKTFLNCDSIIILRLKYFPPSYNTIYRKFCSNSGVWFNGVYRNNNGSYMDTLVNSKGCDSFLTMVLYIDTVHNTSITRAICSYDSFNFHGKFLKKAGLYIDTIKNSGGCDSIVTLNLIVHTPKPLTLSKYTPFVLITDMGFKSYFWYLNKVFLPKEKRHYLEVGVTGTYSVSGLDSNNCYSASNEFFMERSRINNSESSTISIYPIPIKDKIFIQLPANSTNLNSTISIYNIEGVQLFSQDHFIGITPLELDLGFLPNGNYMVLISNKENSYIHKITIER
ncbi:MAG: T9SS type A sorting domain-containing protein [Chitinophagales bacterium]|nr:T9SS type A sorting domain-containing protein [Chitinophagales bacterium]